MDIFKKIFLITLLISWTISNIDANNDEHLDSDDLEPDTNDQDECDDEHVVPEYEFIYKTEK